MQTWEDSYTFDTYNRVARPPKTMVRSLGAWHYGAPAQPFGAGVAAAPKPMTLKGRAGVVSGNESGRVRAPGARRVDTNAKFV